MEGGGLKLFLKKFLTFSDEGFHPEIFKTLKSNTKFLESQVKVRPPPPPQKIVKKWWRFFQKNCYFWGNQELHATIILSFLPQRLYLIFVNILKIYSLLTDVGENCSFWIKCLRSLGSYHLKSNFLILFSFWRLVCITCQVYHHSANICSRGEGASIAHILIGQVR